MITIVNAAVLVSLLSTAFVISQETNQANPAQRKFNMPYNFESEAEVFSLRVKRIGYDYQKYLVPTGNFTASKVSSDFDANFQTLMNGDQNSKTVCQEVLQDFADEQDTVFEVSTNSCHQYPMSQEEKAKSVREVIDETNDPFNNKKLTYFGLKQPDWNTTDTGHYYIFAVMDKNGTISNQVFYSAKTGLIRYTALYIDRENGFMIDNKNDVKETKFKQADFEIKQCESKFANEITQTQYLY
eukprot:403377195